MTSSAWRCVPVLRNTDLKWCVARLVRARGFVSRASPVQTAVRNCTRDEGGPFEVGNHGPISSRCKLLRSKAVVVSVAVKLGTEGPGRQGRERRAQANELRVSASRSRCRNLVGLNAGRSRLPRGPMEFPVGGLGVGAWIADRSEWASPWGEVDHRTRTGCFETGRRFSGCRTGIGAAVRQAPAVA